jgi:hypothetical protein
VPVHEFRTLLLAAALFVGSAFGLEAALGTPAAVAQDSAAIAIVTNQRTTVSDISFLELRKIFLGEMQFWGDNSRIVVVRAPVARERHRPQDLSHGEAEFQQY